jgi:hypothetical protein
VLVEEMLDQNMDVGYGQDGNPRYCWVGLEEYSVGSRKVWDPRQEYIASHSKFGGRFIPNFKMHFPQIRNNHFFRVETLASRRDGDDQA